MILRNKNRYKPVYKQLINLKENLQNREKLLRFKKQKWKKFIQAYKRQLKLHKKIKSKDQTLRLITRYPSSVFSYKKLYKTIVQENKKFKFIYGGISNKRIKIMLNKRRKTINSITLLKLFESRLDVTLFRAKFANNLRLIRQIIYHNKVLINNKVVKIKSFLVKPGDVIKIKSSYSKLIDSMVFKSIWPLCPKHLVINYKIMQIISNSLNYKNFSSNIFYYLNLEKVLKRFYKN